MTGAVDATVVAVAAIGDRILTSDPVDIRELVAAARRPVPRRAVLSDLTHTAPAAR